MQPPIERPVAERTAGRGPNFFSIAPDVHGLRTWIVNLYFIGRPGRGEPWVIVDAGMPGARRHVLEAARELYGDQPPAAVVLTHGHFDHVGALRAFEERWTTPVYAHPLELPYLNGRLPYPPPDPAVGGAMARMSPLFPRHSARLDREVLPLPPDGAVPSLPGWQWIHTPGHTPGHVSFFRPADRLVLAGDAFVTVRQELVRAVAAQRPEVRPPPAYYTVNWREAFASMRRLADLQPEIAATGHGRPMRGEGMRQQLHAILADFEHRGLPPRGRYVGRSWPGRAA